MCGTLGKCGKDHLVGAMPCRVCHLIIVKSKFKSQSPHPTNLKVRPSIEILNPQFFGLGQKQQQKGPPPPHQ